jgi:TonB family protein
MAYLGPSLRREGVRERPALRVAVALALSLALNALVGWLLVLSGAFELAKAPPAPARVALAPIDAKDWAANRAIKGEKAPPSKSRLPEETASGPVVELPPEDEEAEARAPDEAPRDARHSATRNQKVERETVSRDAGVYPKPAPRPQVAVPRRTEKGGEAGEAASAKKGAEGERGDRFALAPAPFGDRMRGDGGEGGRRARGKLAPDLSLGPDTAARVLAGPNFDGYGEGLEEGEATALNTTGFKFATFMNQMRNEVGQEWVPRVRSAITARDPDGSMIFYKDRTVAIGVTLDSDGHVKDLAILESSNVDFFDRVALDSLRAAEPFPNPPRGLFGGDGEARFAATFTLYAGDSRPRLRWFRR